MSKSNVKTNKSKELPAKSPKNRQTKAETSNASLHTSSILQLQQAIGNQAVLQMLQVQRTIQNKQLEQNSHLLEEAVAQPKNDRFVRIASPKAASQQTATPIQRVGKEALGHEAIKGTAHDTIADQIDNLIATIKQEEKTTKAQVEQEKNEAMEKLTTVKDRQTYLWTEYVPKLRKIGLDHDKLMKDPRFIEIHNKEKFTLFKTGTVTELQLGGATFYKLYRGTRAYRKKATIPGLERDVWEKIGSGKEFVQDDQKQFIRRLAYIEKNKYQLWELMNSGEMKGRYKGDAYEKNKAVSNRIKYATDKSQPMNLAEMLYTHQELGSGDEQRGVSLASTSKMIHSNQGEAFKNDEGASFTIDLAQIPKGTDNLVAHYTAEAKEKQSETLKDVGMYASKRGSGKLFDEGKTDKHPVDHYLNSVTKNRELFARSVPRKAIDRVTKRFGPKGTLSTTLGRSTTTKEVDWDGTDLMAEKTEFAKGKQAALSGKIKVAVKVREDTAANIGYDEGFNEGVEYNVSFDTGYQNALDQQAKSNTTPQGPTAKDLGLAAGFNEGVTYNRAFDDGYQDAVDNGSKTRIAVGASTQEKGYAAGYNRRVGQNIDYSDGIHDGFRNAYDNKRNKSIRARDNSPYEAGYADGYNDAVDYGFGYRKGSSGARATNGSYWFNKGYADGQIRKYGKTPRAEGLIS